MAIRLRAFSSFTAPISTSSVVRCDPCCRSLVATLDTVSPPESLYKSSTPACTFPWTNGSQPVYRLRPRAPQAGTKESGMKLRMRMMYTAVLACLLTLAGAVAHAQQDPMVGGAPMYPTKNIVENAM